MTPFAQLGDVETRWDVNGEGEPLDKPELCNRMIIDFLTEMSR